MLDTQIALGGLFHLLHLIAQRELGGRAAHAAEPVDRLPHAGQLPAIGRLVAGGRRHEELDGAQNVLGTRIGSPTAGQPTRAAVVS